MSRKINWVGQKFGRLVVLEKVGKNKHGKLQLLCKCVCGNKKVVLGCHLRSGETKSCGCLRVETTTIMMQNKTGKNNHNYGKHFSEEHKRKISETKKGKNNPMYGKFGKNHPSYNSNLTEEDRQSGRNVPGYSKWRAEVLKRDNYTCQVCGQVGGNLIAHHLESYRDNPELRTKLSNGATVCEKHHLDFHHQYGYGENTEKQFIQFANSPK